MNLKKILKYAMCIVIAGLLCLFYFLYEKHKDQKEIERSLLSQEITAAVGDTISYSDLMKKCRYSADELEWSADGDGIIFGEQTAEIESSGEYVITARKGEKEIINCSVDVFSLSVISFEKNNSEIGEDIEIQIKPILSGGYQTDLFFVSEDDSVATVDENGNVHGISAGKTRIKVSAYGCDSVYYDVSVTESPSAVTLSEQNFKLGVGETTRVTASLPKDSYDKIATTFSSEDENVAVVDKDGLITAIGVGKCEIKATAYSGASASCVVEVGNAPTSVSISLGDDFLYAGETVTAKVELSNEAICNGITFESSNPAVASVSPEGVITGKGRGEATITASTYNGKKSSCKVSVKIFNYMKSPTSQNVYDAVKYLADFYPEIISTEVIGSSVKGKDIMLLKLGKGEKKACIVAGLHAKEDIAVAFTMRCVEEYAAAYSSKSGKYGSYNLRKMLNEYTLYIVPTMNPDGLDIVNSGEMPLYTEKFSESLRKKYKSNANGVNLNRNFPFRWDQTITSTAQPDEADYRGPSESSEPETQAIVKLVENNDFEWLFSMHCRGYFIYWADQYNKIGSMDKKLAYRLQNNCGYGLKSPSPVKNLGGGLENWFRYKTGKPGFCVELVASEYSTEVNKYFSLKTAWDKTKFTFIQGMR